MAVELSDEARKQALASLKRYCTDELDSGLTAMQATMLLDFILKEIAPSAFNAGVAAAQVYLRDRVADVEGACYEPEFVYWPKGSFVRRK
jgi:uncharacterized protein (DUF2164 family)